MPRLIPSTAPDWDAQYPGRASPRSEAGDGGRYANASVRDGVEWVSAPAASHLEAFALYDADRLGGDEARIQRKYLGNESYIYVRFRRGRHTTYEYTFADARQARIAFDLLRAADQPGVVLHAVVERQATGYRPVS